MGVLKSKTLYITSTIGQIDHTSFFNELIKENVEQFVPHFLITRKGDLIEFKTRNSTELVISLEDVGPLILRENRYIDYLGTIYKDTDEIVKIPWRGKEFWVNYTDQQYLKLKEILTDFNGEIILDSDKSLVSRKPNPTFKIY